MRYLVFFGAALVVALGTFWPGKSRDTVADHERAVAIMGDAPDKAEVILRKARSPAGKLDYALFLHAFRPASAERDVKIRAIQAEIDGLSRNAGDSDALEAVPDRPAYDGTDESLVATIALASSVGVANTASAFYGIPCPVLIERPGLLAATAPQFYSNRDNFIPRSGCSWGRGAAPAGAPRGAMKAFVTEAARADGAFLSLHQGSMRHGIAGAQNLAVERVLIDPRFYLGVASRPRQDFPYQTWSYLSLDNRKVAASIRTRYAALMEDLVRYHVALGQHDDGELREALRIGLFAVVFGAECGGAKPAPSLRTMILDDVPGETIRDYVQTGRWRHESMGEIEECAEFADIDPLAHVALGRPDVLAFLFEYAQALAPADRAAFPLDDSVDAPNAFGKTTLMTAAQNDFVASARLLLAKGAAVDPRTEREDPPLLHDARTALHYAAAGGSLEMIALLVSAGADPSARDSKGLRPREYLTGNGPVPPNPRISEQEKAEALRLLD